MNVRPITVTARIGADPDTVFEFVCDPRNDPVWCPNVRDVVQVHGDGPDVGARYTFRQAAGRGHWVDGTIEIEALEPKRRVAFRVEDLFRRSDIELRVAPAPHGTRIEQTTRHRMLGRGRWLTPIMPFLVRRALADQFERLAAGMESGRS